MSLYRAALELHRRAAAPDLVMNPEGELVAVRGAGDIASGVILRLVRCGFRVIALENDHPRALRRTVSFSEAMYEGWASIEGLAARKVENVAGILEAFEEGVLPIIADPYCSCLDDLEPLAVVDAILVGRNLGTERGMAPIVVGLGPGFEAGVDVDAVVETKRGHELGRVILRGKTGDESLEEEDNGPDSERVLKAPVSGQIKVLREIGDPIRADEVLLMIDSDDGLWQGSAGIDGLLRGIIRPGLVVTTGSEVAYVDPKAKREQCYTVSDRARAIAGGVLEAILMLEARLTE